MVYGAEHRHDVRIAPDSVENSGADRNKTLYSSDAAAAYRPTLYLAYANANGSED